MRYLWPAMLTTLCELMRLSDVCSMEGAEEDGLPPLQQQQQQQPASHLGSSRLAAALTNGGKPSSSAPSVEQTSLSLINSQSVVNIAGHKYLIVPHPDPIAPAKYQHAKTARAQKRATEPPKLPILLKPENAAGKGAAAMPAFEVEEVNGQLVLLPTDGASGGRKNPFAKRDEESKKSNSENSQSKQSAKAASSSFGDHLSPNLCGA